MYSYSKKGHKKIRKTCKHCHKDNLDWHRFHGKGAFCRTHFNSYGAQQWCSPDKAGSQEERARRKLNSIKPFEWKTKRVFRDKWNRMSPQQRHNFVTKKYHRGD